MGIVNYREIWQAHNFKKYGEPHDLDSLAHHVIQVISAEHPVVGFSWDIRYGQKISNSHSAPIHGVQNFGGQKDRALGYPGWSGRVWIRYGLKEHHDWSGPGSGPFMRTNTHTGTGGYGDYDGPWTELVSANYRNRNVLPMMNPPSVFSWDYRIYEQDWPAVKQWRKQQTVWAALSDTAPAHQHHWFDWADPATVKQDQEYLNQVHQLNQEGQIS